MPKPAKRLYRALICVSGLFHFQMRHQVHHPTSMRGCFSLFPAKLNKTPCKECVEDHHGGMGAWDLTVLWYYPKYCRDRISVLYSTLLQRHWKPPPKDPSAPGRTRTYDWGGLDHLYTSDIFYWKEFGKLTIGKVESVQHLGAAHVWYIKMKYAHYCKFSDGFSH